MEPCPKGRTDYEACFAPFRYCPEKGCGRTEGPTAEEKSLAEAKRLLVDFADMLGSAAALRNTEDVVDAIHLVCGVPPVTRLAHHRG